MKYIKTLFIIIIGLLIVSSIGYFLKPEKLEVKVEEKTKVKKAVFVKVENIETDIETELFNLVNQERKTKLTWETCLEKSAKERAMDLVERNYFSHEDPLTGKILAWKIIKTNCGEYRVAGENLVKDFREETVLAHRALMNSELHRENIQEEIFKQGAVGCHQGVCVQLFADLN